MVLWVLGISAAYAVALNGTMVMPIVVLALGRIPGYDEGTATLVASAELAGIAIYCLFLPKLAIRNPLKVTIGGLLAAFLGQLLSYCLVRYSFVAPIPLAATRLLAGLGEGAIFSLVAMRIASLANAERLWGSLNLVGGLAMGFLLLIVSALPEDADRAMVFIFLASFVLVMIPFFPFMRARAGTPARYTSQPGLDRRTMVLMMVVVFMVYAVQAGQWAICGYIGELADLTPTEVGLYLAISSLLGFLGAVVPSFVDGRSKRLLSVLSGFAIMAVSLHCFFNIYSRPVFLTAQILLNVGFYIVTPFVTGLLTEHDPDGTVMSRILVVALVGATIGTALAGPVLSAYGPAEFSWIFMVPLAAAALCGTLVFGRLHLDFSRAMPAKLAE